MQQCCHDGLCIKLPFGTDLGYRNRMRDIWIARAPHLTEMHLVSEAVGVFDGFEFGRRQVLGQPVTQLSHRCHTNRQWRVGVRRDG